MAVIYYSKMQQRCRWQIQGKPGACFQASSPIGVTQETLSSLAADGDSTGGESLFLQGSTLKTSVQVLTQLLHR